ncbi:MAG: efflux RND transporter periplasmic adaptor subunit [Alphaproteobacteria bacterium]|nr:efflux RND transporter periplasmic adaptor subunit [Alphaproteobacteria bacterium]MBF0128699.1 efflux RND transporter periplasmic adaptor subunit [Alphaproteobacteria bacterium]
MRVSPWLFATAIFAGTTSAALAAAGEYQTAVITAAQVGHTSVVGGTVIPYKEVNLAAQIPGQVTFIAGSEGDSFEGGAILVQIDDSQIQAQRRAALADISNAEAAVRNAQVQYSRELWSPRSNSPNTMPGMGAPGMFDQFFTRNASNFMGRSDTGLERQADLYAQGSGVNQAESKLLQAHAQLEALDAKLRDAQLAAPFDGMIVKKLVETGDTVQPGTPLLQFAHTTYLRIRADVPVRLVAGLEKGMMVPARLDAGGVEVKARVAQIYPMADQTRHTVTVKFDLPKGIPGGPGMYAEVQIPDPGESSQDLPAIPQASIVWRGSLPNVFVLHEGAPSLRVVRIGSPVGDGRVSILSGVKTGEQVIVNPPAGLVSGVR